MTKKLYLIVIITQTLLVVGLLMWGLSRSGVGVYEIKPPDKVEIPECKFGMCPGYDQVEVDGNIETVETLLYIPVAMTKGAAKFWIIQDGKITYQSPGLAQLGVEEKESGNGFVISYWSDYSDLLNPIRSEANFEYRDGAYVQVSGDPLE